MDPSAELRGLSFAEKAEILNRKRMDEQLEALLGEVSDNDNDDDVLKPVRNMDSNNGSMSKTKNATSTSTARKKIGGDDEDELNDDGTAKKRKKIMRRTKTPKVDAELLVSSAGMPRLVRDAKKLKFKGKSHEADDLQLLMDFYQTWAHAVFPRLNFQAFIDRAEKMCKTKQMRIYMNQLRNDVTRGASGFIIGNPVVAPSGLDEDQSGLRNDYADAFADNYDDDLNESLLDNIAMVPDTQVVREREGTVEVEDFALDNVFQGRPPTPPPPPEDLDFDLPAHLASMSRPVVGPNAELSSEQEEMDLAMIEEVLMMDVDADEGVSEGVDLAVRVVIGEGRDVKGGVFSNSDADMDLDFSVDIGLDVPEAVTLDMGTGSSVVGNASVNVPETVNFAMVLGVAGAVDPGSSLDTSTEELPQVVNTVIIPGIIA